MLPDASTMMWTIGGGGVYTSSTARAGAVVVVTAAQTMITAIIQRIFIMAYLAGM
jgi:hypothetical protein